MHHQPLPSLGVLDGLFQADFESGVLFWWDVERGRAPAGWTDKRGYRMVKIGGRDYRVHRVIYAMFHRTDPGEWEIDHINGVFADNRITNLRLVTRDANCANRRSWRKGLRGAYAKDGRWMAVIQVENKRRYLGTYDTEEEAHSAFRKAAAAHYGELARLD